MAEMIEITEDQAREILDSLRTRNSQQTYEDRCLTPLLESDANFYHNVEDRFPGVAANSVKSQLATIIKEKELPLIVNKSEEWGVFVLKIA